METASLAHPNKHWEVTELEIVRVALEDIVVRERIRQELGDLSELKASMQARGLINAIVVAADQKTLIDGERRLTSARELAWPDIEARIWRPADGLELLDVEAESNLCRKDFTLGEAERRFTLREKLEVDAARERQRQAGGHWMGGTRSGGSQTPDTPYTGPGKFPEAMHDAQPSRTANEGRARDQAARGTGYSHKTLEKVRRVRKTAEDQTQPEEVRKEAQQQYDRLLNDPDAKADPALKAVQLAQKRAERAAKQQEQVSKTGASGQWIRPPEPVKPDPTLTQRLIKAIGTVKGLTSIAAEIEAGASLDLDDHTIQVLRKSLRDQNAENTALSKALGTELSRRKATA